MRPFVVAALLVLTLFIGRAVARRLAQRAAAVARAIGSATTVLNASMSDATSPGTISGPGARYARRMARARRERWLRLLRLLVTTLTLVLARPASSPAVQRVDQVVLVAASRREAPEDLSDAEDASTFPRSPGVAIASFDDEAPLAPRFRALPATAVVGRRYLRHCSLLC